MQGKANAEPKHDPLRNNNHSSILRDNVRYTRVTMQ
jgi:hypothetical protein